MQTNLISLDFGTVAIENNFVIATINEGIMITDDISYQITQYALHHFSSEAFVYITHRIHSYSVDPNVYKMISSIENLAGFAVVSSNEMARENAAFEKAFLHKKFGIFKEIDEAKDWANTMILQFERQRKH